ncbi:MAG: CYTH domain-containing protein [Paludibacteraceae bacterium]
MNNKHIEIERKFLVNGEFKHLSSGNYRITQGYLCADGKRTVRVRSKGEKAFLTIKGEVNENGFSRFEWEKEISLNDAKELLELCDAGIIDKTRYEVIFAGKTFEIDVFHNENEGLLIAELELESENEIFLKPDWLGEEVTYDKRYYNSYISKHPYKNWE